MSWANVAPIIAIITFLGIPVGFLYKLVLGNTKEIGELQKRSAESGEMRTSLKQRVDDADAFQKRSLSEIREEMGKVHNEITKGFADINSSVAELTGKVEVMLHGNNK